MHDLVFQTISMIVGGAVLALGGFIAKILWDFRRAWILDQAWSKEAQKALLDQGNDLRNMIVKFNGLETRVVNLEHPVPHFKNRH